MSKTSVWKLFAAAAILVVTALALLLLRGERDAVPEAGGPVVWKYSVWGPSRAFTRGIESAKSQWEAAGKGRFELQVAYGSALSPEKENLDSIRLGIIEGACVCIGYGPNKTPLAQVLELPFLLTDDMRVNARVIDAVMQHPLVEQELAARWNAKYLMPAVTGVYEFMGNRRVARVDDLKGVRMRISGANATVLEKFGAVPTMVTAPESYTALERGTIDLTGFPWTDSFGAFRLHEVSKYAIVGISLGGFACASLVSLDAWKRMPGDLREMLPQVREQAIQASFAAYDAGDREWLPVFREKLEIVRFPAAERAKMIAVAKPLWAEWAAQLDARGHRGSEILAYAQQQVEKFSASR
jgi:TRAP-type C4-dicarboxylate transport system substrate-binding protein